jgi:serine/threonine-protein kinase
VPPVEGQVEFLARQNIVDAGLKPRIVRQFNVDYREGVVFDQDPAAGEKLDRGNTVTLFVSKGKPRVDVPDVVGRTVDDARTTLQEQGLKANVFEVYSDEPVGTVTAQAPLAGVSVVQGASVRINISQGPRPVAVPNVIGQSYDSAAASLSAAGFISGRVDVDSDQPAGTVVDQDPDEGSLQPPGTKIILGVSRGPQTTAVPDVEGLDRATAVASLRNAGFRPVVQEQETTDPAEDGIVLSQDPFGGDQATPGASVLITVGVLISTETEPPVDDTGDGEFP